MSEPIQQHYVTRAYLEGFLAEDEKHLYVYGRKAKPFRSTPGGVAKIHHYYSIFRSDGTVDFSLERFQAREIEGPGIAAIRMLSSGKNIVSPQQREALAGMIALHSVRIPYEREFMDQNNIEILRSYIRQMDEHSARVGLPVNALDVAVSKTTRAPSKDGWTRIFRADIEAMIQEAEADPGAFSRESFLALARSIARIYSKMKWFIQVAPSEAHFITSDCPVVQTFQNSTEFGAGLHRADCEITFPISKSILLVMRHDKNLIEKVSRGIRRKRKSETRKGEIEKVGITAAGVQRLNELIADSAYVWAFSSSELPWLGQRMKERIKKQKLRKVLAESTTRVDTVSTSHETIMREMVVQRQ